MTRTEEDLRSALESLEHHAPDAQAVLAGIRIKVAARRVVATRRWRRSLLAGIPLATAAALAVLISAPWPKANGPGEPPSGAQDVAAMLRQLATIAAAQRAPAPGPYAYTKTANWGAQIGRPHYGLNYRSRSFYINKEWLGPAGSYFTESNPYGKLPTGMFRSGGYLVNPKDNSAWAWDNPATLPVSPRPLRRHLLSPPSKSGHEEFFANGKKDLIAAQYVTPINITGAPLTPPQAVFGYALRLMQEEPLRPAVRATLLRLMAQAMGEIPASSQRFVDLGVVTDRAGHRGIAIGAATNEELSGTRVIHVATFLLSVYIFDPRTGALSGDEEAVCPHLVTSARAANKACYPASYTQYLQIKAVGSLPPADRIGRGR